MSANETEDIVQVRDPVYRIQSLEDTLEQTEEELFLCRQHRDSFLNGLEVARSTNKILNRKNAELQREQHRQGQRIQRLEEQVEDFEKSNDAMAKRLQIVRDMAADEDVTLEAFREALLSPLVRNEDTQVNRVEDFSFDMTSGQSFIDNQSLDAHYHYRHGVIVQSLIPGDECNYPEAHLSEHEIDYLRQRAEEAVQKGEVSGKPLYRVIPAVGFPFITAMKGFRSFIEQLNSMVYTDTEEAPADSEEQEEASEEDVNPAEESTIRSRHDSEPTTWAHQEAVDNSSWKTIQEDVQAARRVAMETGIPVVMPPQQSAPVSDADESEDDSDESVTEVETLSGPAPSLSELPRPGFGNPHDLWQGQ